MTTKIVAFADAKYIPVAHNWLMALRAIGLEKHAVIVSLDEETRGVFQRQTQVLHRPVRLRGSDLRPLWKLRIAVLREMLCAGDAVIHSDVDAVWLRDPMPDIERCGTAAVFSQGTFWPPDIHKIHRLVVCCGFFYLAPEPKVLAFMEAVAERVKSDRDDQMGVNRVIATFVHSWHIESPYKIMFRDTHFLASRSPIRSCPQQDRPNALSVSVLPHHAYPRVVEGITEETVVAHPVSGPSCAEKQKCFMDLGLWNYQSVC